ncbi:MAG: PKD domain-containing protein [Thermoplasmata archaeon]|nr:PKD domain-containing protein [Thermoplasmata archaeon]
MIAVTLLVVVSCLPLFPGLATPAVRTGSAARSLPTGPVVVAPAYVPGPGVTDLGPLSSTAALDVAVALAPRDPAGLAATTTLEYTPDAPQYHTFLSPSQIAAQFGPSGDEYAAAVAYFEEFGLKVTASPDHTLLLVGGSPVDVGAAFHTTFDAYHAPQGVFFNHPSAATLPDSVPWLGAYGLGNDSVARPDVRGPAGVSAPPVPTPAASCPSSAPYAPCEIQSAYNATTDLKAGDNGSGFRLAVVDTYDGFENQTVLEGDLGDFTSNYGISLGSVQYLYPVPTTRNLNKTSTGWATEEALDLEWTRAMAPGATIEMTFAPDPGAGLYGSVDWLVAHQAANVISLSWGEPDVGVYNSFATPCSSACNATSDGSYAILHPVLADAAAEGIGVFSASGDCGAAEGTNGDSTSYPASDPFVTGVGGTDLKTSGGAYSSEVAWSGNSTGASSPGCANQGGSGGGFAPFARPWWQLAKGLPASPDVRGVPDVAIDGGTSVEIVESGFFVGVGGTSASTVLWAGLATDADSFARGGLGFLNPGLYGIARNTSSNGTYHDVTSGWNGYSAGVGWDAVTGLGSPNIGRLFPQLAAERASPGTLALTLGAGPRFGKAPLVATFDLSAAGGRPPYPLIDVSFGDGNASLAGSGTVTHQFPDAGVYVATATVFDSAGNSSTSAPVAIVVGGGHALNVTLTATNATPSVGQAINLTATVRGGPSPWQYYYVFGDGSYLANTTAGTVSHVYGAAGRFCAAVIVRDSADPVDGGTSSRLAIGVGGASPPNCANPPNLTAQVSAPRTSADLPGDLNLSVTPVGGSPPYTVQWVTDDPYVNACDCGIFRVAGNHTLTAYVNDSVDEQTTAQLNVTLYPALLGTFNHSALSGVAPFSVTFTAAASGGDAPQPNATTWTFGDGTSGTGAAVAHEYTSPGLYVVIGQLGDAGGGVTSAAFVVDALSPSDSAGPALTVSVTPAVEVPAGTLVTLTANVTGGSGPYTYRWDLGDDDSSFGATVTQTFGALPCIRNGACPLVVGVSATDRNGNTTSAAVLLTDAVAGRSAAATLTDSVRPVNGATPLHLNATAEATGISGLSVAWSFGDGGTALGTSVTHTYLNAGNYTVRDTATDPWGDRLVRSQALTITGPARSAPALTGGPNVTAGLAPLFVNFSVSGVAGGGAPYTFAWNFGDGSVGTGSSTQHEFVVPGHYAPVVTVSDSLLDTNESVFTITAYNRTTVTLTASLAESSVAPGALVGATVSADPVCTNLSAPSCSISGFHVAFGFQSRAGGPLVPAGSASPGPTGGIFVDLIAPSAAGSYELNASVVGDNYTGHVEVPLVVQAAVASVVIPYALDPAWILLAGGGVGLAVLLGALAGRREREESSP